MQRDPLVYLDDILESCRKIQQYSAGLTFEQFVADQQTIDAIARNFGIVGRSAKSIPRDIRALMTDVDWRDVAGIEESVNPYFDVDLDLTWQIITDRVAPLADAVGKFLAGA